METRKEEGHWGVKFLKVGEMLDGGDIKVQVDLSRDDVWMGEKRGERGRVSQT